MIRSANGSISKALFVFQLLLLSFLDTPIQVPAFDFGVGDIRRCNKIPYCSLNSFLHHSVSCVITRVGRGLKLQSRIPAYCNTHQYHCPRRRNNFASFAADVSFIDASNSDEEDVTSKASTVISKEELVHAALATHTTTTSPLLGIKSIGIDYGLVRTGLAATIGYDMRPLRITNNLNNTELCHEIISLVKNEDAKRIVVGLPLNKNGTESERSNITRIFATELAAVVFANFGDIDDGNFDGVYLWDERYTSKEAKARIMSTMNKADNVRSEDDLDGTIDADAACLILEHYYKSSGMGAELVTVPEGDLRVECSRAWKIEKERQRQASENMKRKREAALNAREAMMAKVKAMEAEMGTPSSSSRKKKGKKKKKK